jgi:capsule biosynthesis phosphatase
MTNKIIVDLDGTLTKSDETKSYLDLHPDLDLVEVLRNYHERGYQVAIYTARNMRTYNNNIGSINAHTIPIIIDWLRRHNVPFDEIHVGKPWCGNDGFYVDDRAVRPSEFKKFSEVELKELLRAERVQ